MAKTFEPQHKEEHSLVWGRCDFTEGHDPGTNC